MGVTVDERGAGLAFGQPQIHFSVQDRRLVVRDSMSRRMVRRFLVIEPAESCTAGTGNRGRQLAGGDRGPTMIGTTLAQYKVTAALGVGGMGEVWRAEDEKLGREVALKVLPEEFAKDPERMARFEREAKVLASLNHPNIAHLYGLESVVPQMSARVTAAGPSRGIPRRECSEAAPEFRGACDSASPDDGSARHDVTFLVMELVEGEDLSERIKRGPVPVEEATAIALQIAEALEAAHESGHRPPRSQTRQHQAPPRRHGQGAGLRARQGVGDRSRRLEHLHVADPDRSTRPPPASSSAPRPTWRPNRRPESPPIVGPTSGPSASCSGRCSPATSSSRAKPSRTSWPRCSRTRSISTSCRLRRRPRSASSSAAVCARNPNSGCRPSAMRGSCSRSTWPIRRDRSRRRQNRSVVAAAIPLWRRFLPWAVAGVLAVAVAGLMWSVLGTKPQVISATIPPPPDADFHLNPNSPGPVAVSRRMAAASPFPRRTRTATSCSMLRRSGCAAGAGPVGHRQRGLSLLVARLALDRLLQPFGRYAQEDRHQRRPADHPHRGVQRQGRDLERRRRHRVCSGSERSAPSRFIGRRRIGTADRGRLRAPQLAPASAFPARRPPDHVPGSRQHPGTEFVVGHRSRRRRDTRGDGDRDPGRVRVRSTAVCS